MYLNPTGEKDSVTYEYNGYVGDQYNDILNDNKEYCILLFFIPINLNYSPTSSVDWSTFV